MMMTPQLLAVAGWSLFGFLRGGQVHIGQDSVVPLGHETAGVEEKQGVYLCENRWTKI